MGGTVQAPEAEHACSAGKAYPAWMTDEQIRLRRRELILADGLPRPKPDGFH